MKKNTKFACGVVLLFIQYLAFQAPLFAQTNVCFTSAFDNTYKFDLGMWPHSMASADFDNDGKLDLIITNTNARLSLLRGIGNGKFRAAETIEIGSEPTGVTAADFNNDGKIDIAFADQNINLVFVLLGNGNGTFQTATGFLVGGRPLAIVNADFNNDGKKDIATVNYYTHDISVSLGNGSGTFPNATSIAAGINPYSITTGDFNGDGIVDLATANSDDTNWMSGNISVFTGNGSGGFLRVNYTAGWNPTFVTSSDLNQDGRSDLIASNSSGQNISVLLAKTTGGFNAPVNYPVFGVPGHITSSDLNGDGFNDVVVVDIQSNNFLVLTGSVSGSLTLKGNYATGVPSSFIFSPDVNSDAIPDIVLLKPQDKAVAIFLGKPGSLFDGVRNNQTGLSPSAVAKADFNLDGREDIITANFDSNDVGVLLADANGNLGNAIFSAAGLNPGSIVVADFNSDGKPDVAVCNYESEEISLLIGNGDGSFASPISFSVGSKPRKILSTDFDGDMKADIVVLHSYENNISVLYGNGAGNLSAETIVASGSSISDFTTADFNKDGKFDLAILDYQQSKVTLMQSAGVGTFTQGSTFQVNLKPFLIVSADMDADGNTDLIVSGEFHSTAIFKGNGTGGLVPGTDHYSTEIPNSLTIEDFNGDSKADIAYTTSANDELSILLAKPTGGYQRIVALKGHGLGFLIAADVNKDGLMDLAGSSSIADVAVLYNNTAVIKASGPTSFCSGNNVVLSATGNGYSYLWNNGSTARDFTATTSGSYSVTITNQSGSCSSTSNPISVSVPPPAPVVAMVHPTCIGTNGKITAEIRSVTDTYSFDNGLTFQTSNIKSDLTPGLYKVVIRQSSGCISAAASVTLEVPIQPTEPVIQSRDYCRPDYQGSITVNSQSAGETYSIDHGFTFQSSNVFNPLPEGQYKILIKSRSGCISPYKIVDIASNAPPKPDVSVSQPWCTSSRLGQIYITTNDPNMEYSYDDGVTYVFHSSTGALPGSYSVKVRSRNNYCVSEAVGVTIFEPTAPPQQPTITATQPTCTVSTGSIAVDVQQTSDLYSFDNGMSFENSPVKSDLPGGSYKVIVRNAAGCLSTPINVVLSNAPRVPAVPVTTAEQPTCDHEGSVTIIEQTPGDLYSFDNGVSFQTSNTKTLSTGTYRILIKSIGGCSSPATTATILDAPAKPSTPSVTLTQPDCKLSVGSITVAVQDASDTYSFDDGTTFQTSPTRSGLMPGNYSVVIRRNNSGCVSTSVAATINTQPLKPGTPVITIDASDPAQPLLTSSSGATSKWFKDGVLLTGESSTSLAVTTFGSYSVVAVSAEGCESELSAPVEVTITGIEEMTEKLQLYPNPAIDKVLLNLTGFVLTQKIHIKIINTGGVTVKDLTVVATETTSIDVEHLAPGVYHVFLKQSNKTATKSFVKR